MSTSNARSAHLASVDRLFIVDRFRKKYDYYFLTHAHSDHCVGLNSKWDLPVYCSVTTAKLLPKLTSKLDRDTGRNIDGVRPDVLVPLVCGEVKKLSDKFQVTAFDANHCPGSVMFLFEGEAIQGGRMLVTGDLKADESFMKRLREDPIYRPLTESRIHTLYLDTTYVDASFPEGSDAFLPRHETLRRLESLVQELPAETHILIPLYRLGKEDLLQDLSKNTGELIGLDQKRYSNASVLFPEAAELFTRADFEADPLFGRVHVVTRGHEFNVYRQLKARGLQVVCVYLTMMGKSLSRSINETDVRRINYSDHSSPQELINFVSFLNPEEVHNCTKIDNELSWTAFLDAVQAKIAAPFMSSSRADEEATAFLDAVQPKIATPVMSSSRADEETTDLTEVQAKIAAPDITSPRAGEETTVNLDAVQAKIATPVMCSTGDDEETELLAAINRPSDYKPLLTAGTNNYDLNQHASRVYGVEHPISVREVEWSVEPDWDET